MNSRLHIVWQCADSRTLIEKSLYESDLAEGDGFELTADLRQDVNGTDLLYLTSYSRIYNERIFIQIKSISASSKSIHFLYSWTGC